MKDWTDDSYRRAIRNEMKERGYVPIRRKRGAQPGNTNAKGPHKMSGRYSMLGKQLSVLGSYSRKMEKLYGR